MKDLKLATLVLCAGASFAYAAPRESFNIVMLHGGSMPAVGTLDNAGNGVQAFTAVGSDVGGVYTAVSFKLTGTVTPWGTGTYASEAIIEVADPLGNFYYFQPFLGSDATPTAARSFTMQQTLEPGSIAGVWTVQTFELYDDLGVTDSTYSVLAATFDDAAVPTPTPNVDLGDLSVGATVNDVPIINTTAGQVQWIKATLPAVTAAGTGYVDIWDTPSALTGWTTANTMGITSIGLYDDKANMIAFDAGYAGVWNNSGTIAHSLISLGSAAARGAATYAGLNDGADFDGADGVLDGGVYYIAVFRVQLNNCGMSAPGYSPFSGYAGATQRRTMVHISTQDDTASTDPVINAAAVPAAVAGSTVTISCTITAGANPTSVSETVTADLTALGGGSSVTMTGPVAGVYSVTATIPSSDTDFTPAHTVTIHAVDDQSRPAADVTVDVKGLGAVDWDETANGGGDCGDMPGTAQVIAGSGALNVITGVLAATSNDADMYKISICDAANFEATSRLNGTAAIDTQIFLFTIAGVGVALDDDSPTGVTPASTNGNLSSTLVSVPGLVNGDYYLAVSNYDHDPLNAAGEQIWLDQPYANVRVPDGTTTGVAGGPAVTDFTLASWDAGDIYTGSSYRISLRGACKVVVVPPTCSPADVGIQGGTEGNDRRLDNNDFIVFINLFFAQDHRADLGIQGGTAGHDMLWDNNDFVMFINYFFDDQANCTGPLP